MKISYYCGMNVGKPKWKHGLDWVYDHDECCAEGEKELTEEEIEDWKDGCFSMNCPACGAELLQDYDHFEEID